MNKSIFTTTIIGILLLISFVSCVTAINLDISSSQVSNTVLTDLNEPAIYDLTIKNNEAADTFQIYSLVGINITPGSFSLGQSETKTIRFYLMPQESLKLNEETFPFVYQIKNSKGEIQKETITISIMGLDKAIEITPENINPQSNNINIDIKNRATFDFDSLDLKFSSVFFPDYTTSTPLNSVEEKTITIPLDREKVKLLDAGHYLMNIQITTKGVSISKNVVIIFVENPNIDESQKNDNWIVLTRQEIIKKNIGNVKQTVTTTVEKSILSYLFTTYKVSDNINPTVAFNGVGVTYTFQKELIPDDELDVVMTTNWLFPILILIFIIVMIILIKKYTERDFVFRKTVSFVRTKGGEFALKVTLRIKAKKYAERINITDKLPHLVNLYEKFGAVSPHKVDMHNRRLEWNVESMNKGEERVFSYIIYSSKIGVVGRFELPSAKAVYEKDGKIKETTSNRAFFINEPKKVI